MTMPSSFSSFSLFSPLYFLFFFFFLVVIMNKKRLKMWVLACRINKQTCSQLGICFLSETFILEHFLQSFRITQWIPPQFLSCVTHVCFTIAPIFVPSSHTARFPVNASFTSPHFLGPNHSGKVERLEDEGGKRYSAAVQTTA